MNTPDLPHDIEQTVSAALQEDIRDGDLTASLLEPKTVTAIVESREEGVLCGCAWFDEVFRQLNPAIHTHWYCRDGSKITRGTRICSLSGPVTDLLTGERTALNFLQTLSGTATRTATYVDIIRGTNTKILDTRKTLPCLRSAQKYAVSCGGGVNHRMGLYDAILIKENHIAAAGSIRNAVSRARDKYPGVPVIIEVESLEEMELAFRAEPDRILLDNFSLDQLKQAVTLNCNCNTLEASGNVSLETIAEIASTGIDYVSIGDLTKNVTAIDLSLRITD